MDVRHQLNSHRGEMSGFNEEIMQQVHNFFEGLGPDHTIVPKGTPGTWLGRRNTYLRHSVNGGNGYKIYFESFDGSVLEVGTKEKKFFFGQNVKIGTTDELFHHLTYYINRKGRS